MMRKLQHMRGFWNYFRRRKLREEVEAESGAGSRVAYGQRQVYG